MILMNNKTNPLTGLEKLLMSILSDEDKLSEQEKQLLRELKKKWRNE